LPAPEPSSEPSSLGVCGALAVQTSSATDAQAEQFRELPARVGDRPQKSDRPLRFTPANFDACCVALISSE
jgi:hypothetical protein